MKKAIIKMLSILCVGLMIVSSAGESIYAASYSNPKQQVVKRLQLKRQQIRNLQLKRLQ